MATYENDVLMTRKTENGDLHIDYPVTNYGNVLNAPVIYNNFAQVNSNYTEITPLGEVFASMADHSVLTVEITTAQAQYENLTGVLTVQKTNGKGTAYLMSDGINYICDIKAGAVSKPRQVAYIDQVCNDNILINTDYRQNRLVNQRGQLQYTAEWWKPVFDMHKLSGGTVELLPDGVRLTKDVNAGYVVLMTRVEPYKIENGKTYCLSMQIDGEIYNTTFTTPLTQTQWINTPHVAGSIGYDTDAGVYNVTYTIYTDDVNPVIQACKLERGEVSTIHLEQPDYAETLRKCQRYYERTNVKGIFGELSYSGTVCYVYQQYNKKRMAPTVTLEADKAYSLGWYAQGAFVNGDFIVDLADQETVLISTTKPELSGKIIWIPIEISAEL